MVFEQGGKRVVQMVFKQDGKRGCTNGVQTGWEEGLYKWCSNRMGRGVVQMAFKQDGKRGCTIGVQTGREEGLYKWRSNRMGRGVCTSLSRQTILQGQADALRYVYININMHLCLDTIYIHSLNIVLHA